MAKVFKNAFLLLYLYNMNNAPLGIELYLRPTYFVDSEQPDIQRFVKNTIGNEIDKTKNAVKLYYAVRDGWKYNPYNIDLRHTAMKASSLFNRDSKSGYCIEKACLMDTILQYTIEIRLFFFIGLFVLFAAWEILLPDHISSYSRKSRWTWNLILVVLNNFFIRILLPVSALGIAENFISIEIRISIG